MGALLWNLCPSGTCPLITSRVSCMVRPVSPLSPSARTSQRVSGVGRPPFSAWIS
uniref:Uncharacterized protein n=1 Tax=Anguilla anguilla TaxID=7936 RepID=A0A0E9RAZ1_ANGAN